MPALEPQHELLVAELRRRGYQLTSIYDWVNGPAPVEAEEILLRHLASAVEPRTVEGIARALTQKGFRAAVPTLLRRFAEIEDNSARWAIANAIVYHGFNRTDWPVVLSYVVERRFGIGRQNLVWRLHRIKLPETETVLLSLIDDPDVDSFAVTALGRCGGREALERLRTVALKGRSKLMQREVPKAIRRLEVRYGAA
jgi:hypothetical protein